MSHFQTRLVGFGDQSPPPAQALRVREMHRIMCLIRAFDEAAGQAWHAGTVRGSVHQTIGQEAIAAGVCANLRAGDLVSSYHRGHGHCIAKGASIVAMMRELFGRAGGTCGGKGGSMHIADFSVGMLGANGVVGDGVTIALGAAQGVKMLRQDRIVVAFFGDGAMNRGPLLEALNWAAVYHLPLLFVCEDNSYSATTRTGRVSAGGGALARASAFGIHAVEVDGNDVVAVDAAAAALVARVRREGPAFLHAKTYRWRGHLAHDKAAYRDAEEVARETRDDPVARCAAWLAAQGIAPEDTEAARAAAQRTVADALADAEAAPWPRPEALYEDVQDIGAPT